LASVAEMSVASPTRAMGAYMTPPDAARLLAAWALRRPGERVVEPSMGEGSFLAALADESRRRDLDAQVWGVELCPDTFGAVVSGGLVDGRRAIRSDFLAVEPFPADAVVGNPPYVRLRHTPHEQRSAALLVAQQVLGRPMEPSGSVWMPFVLHATRFLVDGGRLALVLPYELTYVRYARPLWHYLGSRFSSVRIVRCHERMFPDILQEVVLLMADGFGGSTTEITFEAYETVADLVAARPVVRSRVPLLGVLAGRRDFLAALLSEPAQSLLRGRLERSTVPVSELVAIKIGYVCGDKQFFHPGEGTVTDYELPERSLRRALTSSRQLRATGLRTSVVPEAATSRLFLPPAAPSDLVAGERRYIAAGEAQGVPGRYKCRVREPWYVTPYVRVPDVVIPVFTERPALMINDGRLIASNSMLCGYLRRGTPAALAAAWFTSLTLLQLELQIHSLGGGLMVLVPREASAVRLPVVRAVDGPHLERVHGLLVADDADAAFAAGDGPILHNTVGLTTDEVDSVQEATRTLAHWRTAVRRQPA
jgi:adenine-specific DNA-methyltransferase